MQLDKEPEQFTEDDLRLVFDYEAKVKFRNEERDKYRKMLHAEYAKLSQVLNEGVVKFNMRVSAVPPRYTNSIPPTTRRGLRLCHVYRSSHLVWIIFIRIFFAG